MKKLLFLLAAVGMVFTACKKSGGDEESGNTLGNQPGGDLIGANSIVYTTTDAQPIKLGEPNAFDATIVSHTYANGKGVISFDAPVTSIGNKAFYQCTSLLSVTIPDSVTSIGNYAFSTCNKLTSVTIPDNVTSIGGSAFANCYKLTSVTIPDSVTSIGAYAFSACHSLTSATISNKVTVLETCVFNSCISLTSITIPDSVTSIGVDAFAGCSSLTSVTIPDRVTEIGREAFRDCSELATVTISGSVTKIGYKAFNRCSSLREVYCKPATPPTAVLFGDEWNAFNNNASDRKIFVPTASVEEYKAAEYWSDYADSIVGYAF